MRPSTPSSPPSPRWWAPPAPRRATRTAPACVRSDAGPRAMKAALFRRHGGPEVLEIAEVPAPVPGPGEVLVAVRAAALNHIDLWLRRGLPALKVPLPHVSGGDICGVVAG